MIMKQEILLRSLFPKEIYTRQSCSRLQELIDRQSSSVVLDFKGIVFISRSFADELLCLFDASPSISFQCLNTNEDVSAMLSTVQKIRNRMKLDGNSVPKMYTFDCSEKLSEYLRST